MSEIDKAWRIVVWLMTDHKTRYYGDYSKFATSEKDVAKHESTRKLQFLKYDVFNLCP